MAWHVYCSICGDHQFCDEFGTRREAEAWIRQTEAELRRYPDLYIPAECYRFYVVSSTERHSDQDTIPYEQWAAAGGDAW